MSCCDGKYVCSDCLSYVDEGWDVTIDKLTLKNLCPSCGPERLAFFVAGLRSVTLRENKQDAVQG